MEGTKKKMGPVIVTGGMGYVGRELVALLSKRGAEVHVIDNMASGEHRLEGLEGVPFELHRCDVRDAQATVDVVEAVKPEVVYHLAAVHYIPACEADPGGAVSTNVAGTVNMLRAVRAGTTFVLASTAAVYAPSDTAHVEQDTALGPIDIYGYTKLHAEQFVRYFHAQQRVRGVIVRLFNVVGPGETNPHLVPAVIKQLASGDTSLRLGNLFPHRDYIDVADAAHGFASLGECATTGAAPIISNLGTGTTHAVGDVVRLIGEAAGRKLEVGQDPERVRAVDRPMLKASTDKLRSLTGWTPQMTLSQAMRRAWESRGADGLG